MPVSLKYRIAIIIFLLEAIMMGIVLWQTLGHSANTTREQFANTDAAILQIVSEIGRVALLTEEYADLQPYLENLLATARIEKALLADARGLVVASSDPADVGKTLSDQYPDSAAQNPDRGESFWSYREIRNSAGLLGVFAIRISNQTLLQASMQSRNLGIGIAIVGMTIIAIVGLVVGFLLTKRLAAVTAAANHFAAGQFGTRSGIQGSDEVGELGQTFDKMAESLQTIQQEEKALIEQLSSKNTQLERFTYTVSHDLKTPLVTVRGFAGMLEKDLEAGNTEAIKKDLQHILKGTATMAQLLEDLLKLSHIGFVVNQMELVDLNSLFDQASHGLYSLVTEAGAEIDIQPDMPRVYVDRSRMLEVALNLLQNALKFSRPGFPVKIRIGAQQNGHRIECWVEDNGIGIAPEYHDLIFGLFNRLDQSYEGTGIGLSLVKSIIEAHRGTIEVESPGEGMGARFVFTLPLPPSDKVEAAGEVAQPLQSPAA